jgi:hypothetical protein
MPRAGFEPATPVTKRLQTYALDRADTGIGTQGPFPGAKVRPGVCSKTNELKVIEQQF